MLVRHCLSSKTATNRYVQTIERLAKIHGKDLTNLSLDEEQMREKIFAKVRQMVPGEALKALEEAEKILGLFVGYEGNQQKPVRFDEALQMILDSKATSVREENCIVDSVQFACNKNSTCVDAFIQAVAYDLFRLLFSIPVCGKYINESAWNLREGRTAAETIYETVDLLFKRTTGTYE